jgi:PAS domain S-box-containing protein
VDSRSTVLLIEDNRADARLIQELLRDVDTGFELEWVVRLSEGLQRLDGGGPAIDAVLLDLSLPDSQGYETFSTLSAHAPRVPVIMLTGTDDEELAMQAVRAGAQDYLVKGHVDGQLLARAVRYAIERRRSDEALQHSEEMLRLAMDASESGVWDLDIRKEMITLSPGCQAMLGFEAVEVTEPLESTWAARIHPDDRVESMKALRDTIDGRSPVYERDHRLLAKDGSWVWVHGKGRVVERAANGEPLRLIITRTNITARKNAEAAAIENARLYEQQRFIATTLQENLIHPLPRIDGLQFGVVGKTAFEPDLVGGDFADVFLMDGALVGLLIGDVTGKGIRAAGLTETVMSTVRAFAMIDSSPGFILGKTNQLLMRHGSEGALVTAFLLVLDPSTGYATGASAGHPSPVLVHASSCIPLETFFGLPLGSVDRDYVDGHATLTAGDSLVFYTDGVSDARRGTELFGEERLMETVLALRDRSPQELAEGVRDAVTQFAGRLRDDLQVLALRFG